LLVALVQLIVLRSSTLWVPMYHVIVWRWMIYNNTSVCRLDVMNVKMMQLSCKKRLDRLKYTHVSIYTLLQCWLVSFTQAR